MKLSLFVIVAVVVTMIACSKDKFLTKPTITVKSINGNFIPLNGTFVITLECTDKEGDVQDSVIIIKKRLNKRVVATIRDTIRYKFPVFPKNTRTQIQATLDYQSILSAFNPPFIPGSNPAKRELDTLILRMAVRDKAGNTSDTISSPTIYVFRQ
ncbi:MAG: hypothetical protein LH619_08530 [Chitinophagaceae bacterium]|nr:hypothetical protein [Chitinophagaceae bacterium]